MRDRLTLSAELDGGRLVVVSRGWDSLGTSVEFRWNPADALAAAWAWVQFLTDIAAAARLFLAFVRAGFSHAEAWTTVASLIPAPVEMSTAWDQAS